MIATIAPDIFIHAIFLLHPINAGRSGTQHSPSKLCKSVKILSECAVLALRIVDNRQESEGVLLIPFLLIALPSNPSKKVVFDRLCIVVKSSSHEVVDKSVLFDMSEPRVSGLIGTTKLLNITRKSVFSSGLESYLELLLVRPYWPPPDIERSQAVHCPLGSTAIVGLTIRPITRQIFIISKFGIEYQGDGCQFRGQVCAGCQR